MSKEVIESDLDEVVAASPAEDSDAPARPRKRHKRQPEEVIARIMTAAMHAFTRDGFKGARLRAIAADAGITIQLLIYHVKTKKNLWQMMMEHVLDQYNHIESETQAFPPDTSAEEKLRHVIASMVDYMASHPLLHRMMIQEGAQPSPRLSWLCDNLIRPDLEQFIALVRQAQAEGSVDPSIDPLRLRYAIVAMASVPFSVPAEYEYFSGKSPFSPGEVRQTIDMVLKFIFRD